MFPSAVGLIVSDSFVIADWTAAPDTSAERPIAVLHLHRSDDEAWIVQTGVLGFSVGGEQRIVSAGESILATRGTPHTYWNAGSEPSKYLLVMTPRIHALIEALHSGGGGRDWAAIFEEYDSELL